jgi:hypothetical protein
MKINIKDLVKDKTAKLSYICNCIAYFEIDEKYQFPINLTTDEWKTTYLYTEYKAITLMRWIRIAINNETLIILK